MSMVLLVMAITVEKFFLRRIRRLTFSRYFKKCFIGSNSTSLLQGAARRAGGPAPIAPAGLRRGGGRGAAPEAGGGAQGLRRQEGRGGQEGGGGGREGGEERLHIYTTIQYYYFHHTYRGSLS